MLEKYTPAGARLRCKYPKECDSKLSFLMLPGGPGLGSESLDELNALLSNNLRSSVWLLDLPNDGSNRKPTYDFSNWKQALVEAVSEIDHVVLVGHSTGGMYIQDTPELEHMLSGLVLMNSAPNHHWKADFEEYASLNPIPEIFDILHAFEQNPSDELLKQITILSRKYCFTPNFLEQGKRFFQRLPMNYKSFLYSEQNFDNIYQARWVPKEIPTLIFSGEFDVITPVNMYRSLPEYSKENMSIEIIKNAAHFPWIENPDDVLDLFISFEELLYR